VETSGQSGLVGTVVDGRYRVLSLLARGGMATVYEATDLRLDRTVALKVMHPHLAHDQAFVSRFQREAKAAARLTHGHVVGVYDQGEAGGLVYLAMEYVPGRTLRDVLREYGPLSPEQALVLLDPVLEALTAAHAAGFVHRDIKPENVLISNDGRVKVADFGLARALSGDAESRTQGMIIGTVAYLSPEQVERGEADGRSDVYAAGILLFEMITGKVPHAGDSPLSVAYQHVNNDVPPPSSVRDEIPADVDALVVTATRRDPSLRYQNAADFLADVRRVRATLPSPRAFADSRDTLIVDATMAAQLAAATQANAANSALPPTARSAVGGPQPKVGPAAPEPKHRRRKAPWVIVGLLLAALVAGVAGWYLAAGPGKQVPVPNIVGATVDEATTALAASGLTLKVAEEQYSETDPVGTIISSVPSTGANVKAAGTVTVVVSKGPERYDVPAVKGMTQAEATAALTGAQLRVGAVAEEYDNKVPTGAVTATSPKAGTSVKPGTAVDLTVSKGPKPVPVPDVGGKKVQPAKAALAGVGLKVDVTSKFSESVAKNVVMSQKPKAGTVVGSGSKVSLVVSKGPPPVTVPNLIDMNKDKAVAALRNLGLKAKVVQGAATPLNRVYSQDPSGGTQIPKGSTVTIRVI
jgi:beta-lactam-binding protein with PASTA domain/tRNA A-37 threonylcarbamoyl transferase component Bud32